MLQVIQKVWRLEYVLRAYEGWWCMQVKKRNTGKTEICNPISLILRLYFLILVHILVVMVWIPIKGNYNVHRIWWRLCRTLCHVYFSFCRCPMYKSLPSNCKLTRPHGKCCEVPTCTFEIQHAIYNGHGTTSATGMVGGGKYIFYNF